jgi:hypothetical protein
LPINRETQQQVATILEKSTLKVFKEIAKLYHQSVSARIAYLIDKDIKEHKKQL